MAKVSVPEGIHRKEGGLSLRFVGTWRLVRICCWLWLLSLAPSVGSALPLPAKGVRLLWGSVADHDRPTALLQNPAGLAYQPAWGFHLLHSGLRLPWSQIDANTPNPTLTGDGLALHLSLKLFDFLGTGIGLQYVYPSPPDNLREQLPAHLRLTLGNALRFGKGASLGFNVHFFLGSVPELQALVAFDVGLILRPWNFLSMGVHIRDLYATLYGQAVVPRKWEIGLAIRPLLNDRLTISADMQLQERVGGVRVDSRYRIELEPIAGLVVGASFSHSLPAGDFSLGTFFGVSLWALGHRWRRRCRASHRSCNPNLLSTIGSLSLVQREVVSAVVSVWRQDAFVGLGGHPSRT